MPPGVPDEILRLRDAQAAAHATCDTGEVLLEFFYFSLSAAKSKVDSNNLGNSATRASQMGCNVLNRSCRLVS